MSKRAVYHDRVTENTSRVRLDRDKLTEYARALGHSETSLSEAYATATYLGKRFNHYDGMIGTDFIDWCNRMYPWGKEKLQECIIPEKPPVQETKTEEQLQMTLPSVVPDRIVRVQPVSLVGINQVVEALHMIAERLERLEEAWNGGRRE